MYRMMRGTVVLCVILFTPAALAQGRWASVHVSRGATSAPPHAYLPPAPSRGIPARAHYGVEPAPLPPSFVPGSPLAPRDPTPAPFTGFSGGRHVTYAGGMIYYLSYPWAQEQE